VTALRIGYFNQDFVPEVGAGPARILEMSRQWQARGAVVDVVCAVPNRRIPGVGEGQVAAEYRGRWLVRETREGIAVVRSRVYATPRSGFVPKVVNNLSFLATGTWAAWRVMRPVDVLIASSPPFFPHVGGAFVASRRNVPLVLEVRDLWPDYLVQMGVLGARSAVARALFALERRVLQRAQLVVAVTESFRERLIAKGVPRERTLVIPNGVEMSEYDATPGAPAPDFLPRDGAPIVGYLGTFGKGQGLADVVRAAKRIAEQRPDVHVLLVGDGPDKPAVMAAIAALGVRNVHVHPPIHRSLTKGFYSACAVCLVPLAPIPIFQETIPSKIFEVMACERPLVASVSGEAAAILEASAGGLRAEPGNAADIADAVLRVLAMPADAQRAMGARARAYAQAHYDRRHLADRYLDALMQLTGRTGSSAISL
jgi:colanic acid biosynthesis glycosyl transferase WcaI